MDAVALALQLRSLVEAWSLRQSERVLMTPFREGGLAFETLLAPLTTGATLVLAAVQLFQAPKDLAALAGRQQVQVACLVLADWEALFAHSPQLAWPGLRLAVVIQDLRQAAQPCDWVEKKAAWGFAPEQEMEITRCWMPAGWAVCSQRAPIDSGLAIPRQGESPVSTLGTLVSGIQAYILDAANNPLPVGALGWLYLAGPGLGTPGKPVGRAESTSLWVHSAEQNQDEQVLIPPPGIFAQSGLRQVQVLLRTNLAVRFNGRQTAGGAGTVSRAESFERNSISTEAIEVGRYRFSQTGVK
jgi:non-ribosomal peptide synthetase component F